MKSGKRKIVKYVLVFTLFVILIGCSPGPEKDSMKRESAEITRPKTHTIEMSQMKFNPAALTVKKGDNIIFVNHDIVAHDVTEESTKAWNSSPMSEGQTWTMVAIESVDYYCSIHPVMKGKIVVR